MLMTRAPLQAFHVFEIVAPNTHFIDENTDARKLPKAPTGGSLFWPKH